MLLQSPADGIEIGANCEAQEDMQELLWALPET